MEFCSNGDLSAFLTKWMEKIGKKYPVKEKFRMMLECSSAYSHLHSIGIIHRDVKLENVFIDENESCKIADFGVSRVDKSSAEKTRTAR